MGYSFEKTSFLEATAGEKHEVVELFLRGGMSPNVKTQDGRTPLHLTSRVGRPKVVETLLENGADVNAKASDGSTALHFAARTGKTDVVKELLDKGAEINAQREGPTSLNLRGVEKSDKPGDFDAPDPDVFGASTALMEAAFKGDVQTVEVLLGNGADPNIQTENGYTALLLAAVTRFWDSEGELRTKHAKTMEILLKNGANPNVKAEGRTPLIMAIEGKNDKVSRLLIENGANTNLPDGNGETALMIAVENKNTNIMKFLLENGANPDARNEYGQVAITDAAGKHDISPLKILLRNGANPNLPGMEGETPLIVATYRGRIRTVKLLLENGAETWVKHARQHPNSLDNRTRNAKNVSTYGKKGDTPLEVARRENREEIEKILLRNGAG